MSNIQVNVHDSLIAGEGKQKGTTWLTSSMIIIANMLGAGVLGIPNAFKRMGYVGGITLLATMTLMSIVGGLILGKLRGTNTNIHTYTQLATHYSKPFAPWVGKWLKNAIGAIGYTYMFGSCTVYLITMKISVMEVLQDCVASTQPEAICGIPPCSKHGVTNLHDTVWLLITAAVVFPFIHIRTLSDAGLISYFGVITIAVVNSVILVTSIREATEHHDVPATHSYDFSFQDFVNGLTTLAFAFGGHVLMIEIQNEMVEPKDWPKAIWFSQIFMGVNYLIIGTLGYSVYGDGVDAPITLNLSDNPLRSFTNVCLFFHVLVAYCINSTVLCAAAYERLWPGTLYHPGGTGWQKFRRWGVLCTSVLVLGIIVAVVVPIFSDLMNVFSSLGIFSLSFLVPSLLFLMVYQSGIFDSIWSVQTPWIITVMRGYNMLVIFLAIAGACMGMWAASSDIKEKWEHCDLKIKF